MNIELRKKLVIFSLLTILFMINSFKEAKADDTCILDAELAYQDPYPAIAGSYVEVLFQVNGLQGNCRDGAYAELVLEYPFSLDSKDYTRILGSSTYFGAGYDSKWNILYKIRVDENALEGDYDLELRYNPGTRISNQTYSFEKFNINIEDGLTDFEVHIQNYKIKERQVTFEILNAGNQDINALTIEIPKQENIQIKGSNRNIVGDLDSEDYTTADFEAILEKEGEITMNIYYTDSTNERRSITKTVYYDPEYFNDSLANKQPDQTATYFVVIVIIALLVLFYFRKKDHKKRKLLLS